jgi:AcrR family transcriptional regulator
MTTKERIVSKAIELYNLSGITNVTSRDIAREIGISHGNLEYHFKNKEVLLNAIYDDMRSGISTVYEQNDFDLDPLQHFQNLLSQLEILNEKYLFFNLDILEIARKFPHVKAKLDQTLQLRKTQTSHIIKRFIESNYFKPEPSKGYYLRLQHIIRILITFWKSQEEILVSYSSANSNEMSRHIWDLLLPHMTVKGYNAYKNLIENIKIT